MDHTSVDSIQLLRMDLQVDPGCVHKKEYPLIDTNNQENVLKMADTKIVRRFVAAPRIIKQTSQNVRTVPTAEPQRMIQTQQIVQTIREPITVKNFVLPKNTSIRSISGQNMQGKIVIHPNDPSKRMLIQTMPPPKNPSTLLKLIEYMSLDLRFHFLAVKRHLDCKTYG